jgi:hypothetical protein
LVKPGLKDFLLFFCNQHVCRPANDGSGYKQHHNNGSFQESQGLVVLLHLKMIIITSIFMVFGYM